MQVGSTVKDNSTGDVGRIVEETIYADGHSTSRRFTVEFVGGTRVRSQNELTEYLTNDGRQTQGQFLTED
jgi:hypothetical protein|tara:strand:+ start:224 stop:433 length:210 start_codon:yes stop_codon:yes gene_type:complete